VLDFFSGRFWYSTPKYFEEVCCCFNGEVMLQGNWDLAVGWVQAPGVGEAEAVRCRNVETEASVVVGGGSSVEPIGCMWCPRRSRSWIVVLVPSGASGVLLKSKLPWTSWLADYLGFRREKRSMFNVISTCGRNSSQSWRGQSISTVARAAMICSLNVAMACSAAFA
jgi:hypothetical protein